jgi:hypothetical protein
MHVFTDDRGREWTLALTIASVKRIKAVHSIDLLAPPGRTPEGEELPNPIERLTAETLLCVDVIFTLLADQVREPAVSRDEFDSHLGGRALGDAVSAFTEELEDFFLAFGQGLTRRQPKDANASTPGSSPTGLPESSDSTRTPSP